MLKLHAYGMAAMLFSLGALAQSPAASTPPQAKPPAGATKVMQQHISDGQRVFEQNCSRCHTAPDGFSPRISGTVVRHMRVRASLSQADYEALKKFFNP